MTPLRIWLVGTGTVGTWLAGALGSQRERLAASYGLNATVVGVASARGGFLYDADGLDLASLPAAPPDGGRAAGGGRMNRPGAGHWPMNVTGTTNAVVFQADPVGQVTVTGPGAGPRLAGQGVLSGIIAVASHRAAGA